MQKAPVTVIASIRKKNNSSICGNININNKYNSTSNNNNNTDNSSIDDKKPRSSSFNTKNR